MAQDAPGTDPPAPPVVDPASGPPAEEGSTEAALQERIAIERKRIAGDTTLDEAVRTSLQQKLDAAEAVLAQAGAARERAEKYRTGVEGAVEEIAQKKAALEAMPLPPETGSSLTENERALGPAELKVLLATVEAALSEVQSRRDDLAAALGRAESESSDLIAGLAAVKQEIRQIESTLGTLEQPDGATNPAATVEQLGMRASLEAAKARDEELEAQRTSLPSRLSLLKAQQDFALREFALAEARVAEVRARVNESMKDLASESAQLAAETATDDDRSRELAEEIRRYSEELVAVTQRLETAQADVSTASRELGTLDARFRLVQRQLKAGSGTEDTADMLHAQWRTLPDSAKIRRNLRSNNDESTEARLAQIQIDTERSRMIQAGMDDNGPADLLATKQRLLDELSGQYGKLVDELGKLELQQRSYLDLAKSLNEVLREKLFWVRSAPPIGVSTVGDLPSALHWLAGPERWSALGRALGEAIGRNAIALAVLALLYLASLVLRSRFRARQDEYLLKLRRISEDQFRYTLQAIGFVLLITGPLPLLVAATALGLRAAADGDPWLVGLGSGLVLAAGLLFFFSFVRELCRKDGVAEHHFRLPRASLLRLRRAMGGIACLYIPWMILVLMLFLGAPSHHNYSLGRLMLIANMLSVAGWGWFALDRRRGIFAAHLTDHPRGWTTRLSFLALLFPLAMIILACMGYIYTAVWLVDRIEVSLVLIGLALLVYLLMLRWFRMHERRDALARLLAERQARREETEHEDEGSVGEEAGLPEVEEESLSREEVGTQTRRLLRAVAVSGALVALWFAWSNALPVFRGLDTHAVVGNATIADLLLAAIFVAASVVVARNLPGILEFAILGRLPIDSGLRYTLATLLQYAVVAIGFLLAVEALNVDWAQFGWIMAALSVGLGFGLQEIVANFVCGIILLFERPIRVGDVVTVSNTTGVVSRIRIRATTITDWDRKEFVVPNKEFITGRLLNWTLSNTLNRIVLQVGIAYGSDTEKARKLLAEIVSDHPDVLEEPAPLLTLENLGESSLDFTVRLYLPNLDRRLAVTHELYSEIHRRFRAEGIEIPFPQRDLHLRSGEFGGASGSDS